jgi:hypothetical protein
MQPDINFNDSYSNEYSNLLEKAQLESNYFNFPNQPIVCAQDNVSDLELNTTFELLADDLYPYLKKINPGYWGNSCQELSSHIFAFLNAVGVKADIVIGEVQVHGTLEFDTTLAGLRKDYDASTNVGDQELHAWVSIGGDTIIDAGLPDRMVKHYKLPQDVAPPIFIDRATNISSELYARHQPIIIGADFLAKTNSPNPILLIEHYKSIMRKA